MFPGIIPFTTADECSRSPIECAGPERLSVEARIMQLELTIFPAQVTYRSNRLVTLSLHVKACESLHGQIEARSRPRSPDSVAGAKDPVYAA